MSARSTPRIYSELPRRSNGQCQFVGILDTDMIKVRALAEKVGSSTFTSAEEMTPLFVDAVSIATPTETHYKVARLFLERRRARAGRKADHQQPPRGGGTGVAGARDQLRAAVTLAGRVNPVMRYLNDMLKEARFVEVHRLSPYPGRSSGHWRCVGLDDP